MIPLAVSLPSACCRTPWAYSMPPSMMHSWATIIWENPASTASRRSGETCLMRAILQRQHLDLIAVEVLQDVGGKLLPQRDQHNRRLAHSRQLCHRHRALFPFRSPDPRQIPFAPLQRSGHSSPFRPNSRCPHTGALYVSASLVDKPASEEPRHEPGSRPPSGAAVSVGEIVGSILAGARFLWLSAPPRALGSARPLPPAWRGFFST